MATEGKLHLSAFYHGLARVMKPGRAVCVHVMQISRKKRNGESGAYDFRGLNIRLAERAGLIYEYDWLITKDPQAQAIRTKSHTLQFASLKRDRAVLGGAYGDYIIKFRAPGENAVPINTEGQVSNNDWIQWAEAAWTDIIQTDTLNIKAAKSEEDTRHICPLQLEVIRRCILLFSNPGELVYSPFTGVGSEGFMAIGGRSPKTGKRVADPRRFYGCELKKEYYEQACRNLASVVSERAGDQTADLFAAIEGDAA